MNKEIFWKLVGEFGVPTDFAEAILKNFKNDYERAWLNICLSQDWERTRNLLEEERCQE